MSTELIAGLAGAAVFLLIVIVYYNRFVRLRLSARSAWSDIDVHLKKRYELVPNLVEVVRGYTDHEAGTLTKVTQLRTSAMQAGTPAEKARAENALTLTLRSLFGLVEAYPALKADAHFQNLATELRQLEDNIEYARRYYNASVRDYNIATAVFPPTIIAAAFSFTPEEFFALDDPDKERKPVTVQFGRNAV